MSTDSNLSQVFHQYIRGKKVRKSVYVSLVECIASVKFHTFYNKTISKNVIKLLHLISLTRR